MKLVSSKQMGISIAAISIIVLLVLLTVSLDYARITHSTCPSPYCTILTHIPPQSYAGFGLLLLLAGFGGYLVFQPIEVEKVQNISKSKLNKTVKNLQGEEKKIFNAVVNNDGSVFQNDLIGNTGFSKVKVSRILDRLETKGLVERRRRGMSNIVVLK